MRANHREIERLETLIAYAAANAAVYCEAAAEARGRRVAVPLAYRANERAEVAGHLERRLSEVGGAPDMAVPVVEAACLPDDAALAPPSPADLAMVRDAWRDEAELRAAFEDALGDDALSAGTRMAVLKAYVAVRAGGDQLRDLGHALHRAV